jgi:threonine dehydratase
MKNVIVRTPLVPLHSYDSKVDISLKPEILQPIGSFKIRGKSVCVISGGSLDPEELMEIIAMKE